MAGWRVVKLNGLDIRACGLVDTKIKYSRICNRITKVRKVSVNQSLSPSNARKRLFEAMHKHHITLRMM